MRAHIYLSIKILHHVLVYMNKIWKSKILKGIRSFACEKIGDLRVTLMLFWLYWMLRVFLQYVCVPGIIFEYLFSTLLSYYYCFFLNQPTPQSLRYVHKKWFIRQDPPDADGWNISQDDMEKHEEKCIDKYFKKEFPKNKRKILLSSFL